MVFAVESEVRQILINVLSNAAKHTAAGTHVSVSLAAHDGVAELAIADNGQGIPEEFLENLFTRFSRADPARTSGNGFNSSGLGLAIVEALTHANQGTITAESTAGATRFTITLPIHVPTH